LTTGGHPTQGLQNYFPDTYNPFVIKFAQPVTAAAFEMVTNGHTDTFTALLKGVVVESFTHKTGGWAYYGFTGIMCDEIQVHIGQGQHPNDHMRLVNVQIGAAATAAPNTPGWRAHVDQAVNCRALSGGKYDCLASGPGCNTQAVPGQCSFPKAQAQ